MSQQSPLDDSYYNGPSSSQYSSYDSRRSGCPPKKNVSYFSSSSYSHVSYKSSRSNDRPSPYSHQGGQSSSSKHKFLSSSRDNSYHGQESTYCNTEERNQLGYVQESYSERFKSTGHPKELTDLFGALECKLCGVEVTAPIVAKMHYSGKTHLKKVKQYLIQWSERNGLPMPDVKPPMSNSATALPEFCEVCNVTMISMHDKIRHFAGKMHKKNEFNPPPINARKRKRAYETIDVRFGIGTDFSSGSAVAVEMDQQKVFVCEICDVKACSEEQLEQHFTGKKHKEKLVKQDANEKREKRYQCTLCDVSFDNQNQYQLHIDGKRHAKALSKIKQISSGANNCDVCNISFTSLDHYQNHIAGKKHEKKCQSLPNNSIVKIRDEKISITCMLCPYVGTLENHVCDKSLESINHMELENKFLCSFCSMTFDSEQLLDEHKHTRRHLLCVMNQEDGDPMIPELKHYYCIVCKKQYRTNKDYTNHYFESKHVSRSTAIGFSENKTDLFHCAFCDLVMDYELHMEHLKDPKHVTKSLEIDTINTVTDLANKEINTQTFLCKHCDVVLHGFVQYSEHLLGDSHMQHLVNAKMGKHLCKN